MASGTLDPISAPSSWDVVILGTTPSPGFCKVKGFKRVHEFDIKKGKGTVGATVTFTQKPPVEGEITFYLWDNGSMGTGHNHFVEWEAFRPLLKYDPTKKTVQAIDLFYPSLADIDVSSVVTTNIGGIEPDGDNGMYSITVAFLEYFPPGKNSAVSTPNTSGTGGPPPVVPGTPPGTPPPTDPEQEEIAKLLAQAGMP